ncbi:hypothetical protein EDWATA_00154 [Edwardsiella tarda ATCC 23685]|uniref:Uncharacterized protein n=1 Tax=Edwardsiella tarda ATCC 23685 TaxID=500638 RepID=D4F0D0_EDWTA|nr:hypothetical protein EDWATA_00154 [Edwardsiella tarda ATCC 23685]
MSCLNLLLYPRGAYPREGYTYSLLLIIHDKYMSLVAYFGLSFMAFFPAGDLSS